MGHTVKTAAAFLAALTIILTGTSGTAWGQRTADRQMAAGADAVSTSVRWQDTGAEIHLGQYRPAFLWKGWLDLSPQSAGTDSGHRMTYGQVTAGADLLLRVCSTRTRSLGFYAGGGAFLGAEGYDLWDPLPSYITTDLPEGKFIYGIRAAFELEIFLSRKTALVLSARLPLTISSLMGRFHPQAGIGIRTML